MGSKRIRAALYGDGSALAANHVQGSAGDLVLTHGYDLVDMLARVRRPPTVTIITRMSRFPFAGAVAVAVAMRRWPETRILVDVTTSDTRAADLAEAADHGLLARAPANTRPGDWLSEQIQDIAAADTIAERDGLIEDIPHLERLTPQSLETLRLRLAGYSIREAAGLLSYGPSTVRAHLKSAYTRLGVNTDVHALRLGLKWGFAPDPKPASIGGDTQWQGPRAAVAYYARR